MSMLLNPSNSSNLEQLALNGLKRNVYKQYSNAMHTQ